MHYKTTILTLLTYLLFYFGLGFEEHRSFFGSSLGLPSVARIGRGLLFFLPFFTISLLTFFFPPFPSRPFLFFFLPFPVPPHTRRTFKFQLGSLAERCKLPQKGLGRSPSQGQIWGNFSLTMCVLAATILIFS